LNVKKKISKADPEIKELRMELSAISIQPAYCFQTVLDPVPCLRRGMLTGSHGKVDFQITKP